MARPREPVSRPRRRHGLPAVRNASLLAEPDANSPGSTRPLHLWLLDLRLSGEFVQELRRTLSVEEMARADARRVEQERNRYTAAHGLLRHLLARNLDIAPADVAYEYGDRGKPQLDRRHASNLRFNLSHSGDLGACATIADWEVGVDVEQVRGDRDHEALAERCLSPSEQAALHEWPLDTRIRAFYDCWTLKEAYIKARGDGLFLPLNSFDVELLPGAPPALLRSTAGADEPGRWRFMSFTPLAGFAGAVAVQGHEWQAIISWLRAGA
jgi:4'-phosphopantetheinyl transferase